MSNEPDSSGRREVHKEHEVSLKSSSASRARAEDRLSARRLSRSGLVGGFAHEIKNPLSTIGLNLRLMEEELREARTPREARLLKRTSRLSAEVQRLENILDEFLDYVRAPGPDLALMSLNELVRTVSDLVAPGMESEGFSVRVYLKEGLPLLNADSNQLHQTLLNLTTNAHQAMKASGIQGELLIQTDCKVDSSGSWHELSVTDSGPGMSATELERCFQPYFSTKQRGSGLGLSIAKRFVEDHGGEIEVETKKGVGTRFLIRLPTHGNAKNSADAKKDAVDGTELGAEEA